MKWIASAFSPMMMNANDNCLKFEGIEIDLKQAQDLAVTCHSAIGHENTAKIISALVGFSVPFNRQNLILNHGDELIVIIPNFRAAEAREFTFEEVSAAGFRCFRIYVGEYGR